MYFSPPRMPACWRRGAGPSATQNSRPGEAYGSLKPTTRPITLVSLSAPCLSKRLSLHSAPAPRRWGVEGGVLQRLQEFTFVIHTTLAQTRNFQ